MSAKVSEKAACCLCVRADVSGKEQSDGNGCLNTLSTVESVTLESFSEPIFILSNSIQTGCAAVLESRHGQRKNFKSITKRQCQ